MPAGRVPMVRRPRGPTVMAFPMTCDVKFTPPPAKPLPDESFFMLLVGKPGSGKSTLLLNLLLRNSYYARRFDRVYVISPSQATLSEDYFLSLPESQKTHEYSQHFLQRVLDDSADSGRKVLLVMDDVVNQIDNSANMREILKLIFNRRHVCGAGGSLSLIITTQVYNRVPLRMRKCATAVVIFRTTNQKELDFLYDELVGGIDKKEYLQVMRKLKDDHDFMVLNCNTQQFVKNMEEDVTPRMDSTDEEDYYDTDTDTDTE